MKNENRKYYTAYEERYKTAHAKGVSWSNDVSTPIVLEVINKYHINCNQELLEIGCGEGRDSKVVLDQGYKLMATDISNEAISYCKKKMPQYESSFHVLDCLSNNLNKQFDFIYAIALIHMFVLDEDRNGCYQFIFNHLNTNGIALICTMGDGEFETQSDIRQAFTLQERDHESGKMMVAGTSCRMVSFDTFEKELKQNGFAIIEKGITSSLPNFNRLMYAVVKR
ncbi:MAG: class I SAM-dependent methyltransferase [Traorella sp.]